MSKRALLAQYPQSQRWPTDDSHASHPRGHRLSAEASSTSVPATATDVSFSAGYLNIQSQWARSLVFADQAPTCQAADRRRTKQSGPEARVWLGDHDPPTP